MSQADESAQQVTGQALKDGLARSDVLAMHRQALLPVCIAGRYLMTVTDLCECRLQRVPRFDSKRLEPECSCCRGSQDILQKRYDFTLKACSAPKLFCGRGVNCSPDAPAVKPAVDLKQLQEISAEARHSQQWQSALTVIQDLFCSPETLAVSFMPPCAAVSSLVIGTW